MRKVFAAGAALAATISGAAAASSQDLCAAVGGGRNEGGNYFCQSVNKIVYSGINQSGSYKQTTNMDVNSKVCSKADKTYSGPMAPLDGEVSLHLRGPLNLNKLAVYTLPSASKKARRAVHHAHQHLHEKRNMVIATMDGKVVSWANDYNGGGGAATPAPGGAYGPAPAAATPGPSYNNNPAPKVDLGNGDWGCVGSYDVSKKADAYGLSFLNQKGADGVSGTWDMAFGNSLSFATSDGKSCSPNNTPFDGKIDSTDTEVIVMSDKACQGNDCGYVRPKSVAQHGFGGTAKAFFFEIQMPFDGKKTTDGTAVNKMLQDAPAVWMLNADIPRILQYGSDGTGTCCSCWSSGCGEFDIIEVLATGDNKCKSTLHRQNNSQGGDSNYFDRPTSGPGKYAVVMYQSTIAVSRLDDNYDFGPKMTADQIKKILNADPSDSKTSVFNVQ